LRNKQKDFPKLQTVYSFVKINANIDRSKAYTKRRTLEKSVNFSVDKSIINHLITHQAGSIEKAIIELVMNSIDAGANQIEIEFSPQTVRISDNGHGFPSREYIENFFGVFGAPHAEDSPRFGKFRMGRGQMFAYGSSVWRSGRYMMSVDIQNKGLVYTLEENLEIRSGCCIEVSLYRAKDIAGKELEKMLAYCESDIFINKKRINRELKSITFENEYFRYAEDKNSYDLSIYNQGVLVKNSWLHGFKGVLVSKVPMEVNFARNDILTDKCDVWASFSEYMEEIKSKNAVKGINRVIPVEMSEYYVRLFFERKIDVEGFLGLKIYRDVNGKHYNILQIIDGNFKHIVVEDPNSPMISDALNQFSTILVIDKLLDYYLGYYDGKYTDYITDTRELIIAQLNVLQMGLLEEELREQRGIYTQLCKKYFKKRSHHWRDGILSRMRELREAFEFYEDIDGLEKQNPVSYKVYSKKELGVFERDVYNIVNRMNSGVFRLVRNNTTSMTAKRELLFGDSQGRAFGWTDGENYIVLDMSIIENAKKNIKNVELIATTLLHEYCHNGDDTQELVHDIDFYKTFHDAMQPHPYCRSISELVSAFVKSYIKAAMKHNVRVPKTLESASR